MSGLQRITFKKGRTRAPRLSPPRVHGRHSRRFWSAAEDAVIKRYYPEGGTHACLAHLGPHRTPSGVYQRAGKLGVTAPRGLADYKGANGRVAAPPDIDDILRREYELQDGKKRGAINAIADKLALPRWWVTKRAIELQLTMPHKKEPPWTKAEVALMRKVPLHDPFKCAEIFRAHGFARSPSAIMVKAKRLQLSRRFNEGFSATQAAAVLGFDSKTVSVMLVAGEIKASKRADRRLPQQGGSRWIVAPADLRAYVLEHLERIDLRKVDKFAFVQLIANEPLDKATPAEGASAKPDGRRSSWTPERRAAQGRRMRGVWRRKDPRARRRWARNIAKGRKAGKAR